MGKVNLEHKRLGVGSWSIPLSRSAISSRGNQSERSSTAVSPVTKDAEAENATENVCLANPATAKSSSSSLISLAATITRETEKLDRYLKETGNPMPGFDIDAPSNFPRLPAEVKKAREEVIRATKELGDLVTGPTESVRWMAWDHNNSLSMHAIYHYKIAQSFPINETATYAQIAEIVSLDEVNVRRFLRHSMTNRIFKEPAPGVVAHTAASRVIAEDPAMDSWIGFCVEDMWPAASRTVHAINLNSSASEPTQTGFCLANNTTDVETMFVTFGRSPLRAKRMGGAMASLTGGEGYEVSYLLDNYPWADIDAACGTVVDIGGSHGFVCIDLAKRFKNLKFVVQDLPKTVSSAPNLEGEFGERIKFQAHDFHTQQPVQGADVYLYRWILHNHSDKYAINMLRQLIPALKRGSRIIINDHCLPEPGEENLWDEKIIRTMDLVMLTLLNAQERTADEFKQLFNKASPGFKFMGVTRPRSCRMSIVEAVWEGKDYTVVTGEDH